VKELDHLPPSEARKLLALAAITLKGRARPHEVVAVIRTNGVSLDQDDIRPLVRAMSHRLLERKRAEHAQPTGEGLRPLVVDLADLRQDVQVQRQAMRSTGGLFQVG
jgi:hypothetical protein